MKTSSLKVQCPKCEVFLSLEQLDMQFSDEKMIFFCCPLCDTILLMKEVLGE